MINHNKFNHECRNCHKQYFACNDCEKIHSWKTICCSIECYDQYAEKVIRSRMRKMSELEKVEEPVVEEKVEQEEIVTPDSQND